MDNMLDTLFGPLDKKYCNYFYILSVLGFILMAIGLISLVVIGMSKNRGLEFYMQTFTVAMYGVFYFQNRLLHSMCTGSMK